MSDMPKNPQQPIVDDEGPRGQRFKPNLVVSWMLIQGRQGRPFDLDTLPYQMFSIDDLTQFAQLLGYSLVGFCELSWVDSKAKDAIWARITGKEDKR